VEPEAQATEAFEDRGTAVEVEEYRRIAEAEDAHWWYCSVRRVLKRAAEGRLAKKTGRYLDAGCGPGGNSTWVPPDFDVYGVDISPEAVTYASAKRPGMRAVRASVTKLPFEDESFDGLQSITVICHTAVESVESALMEYRRVLRTDGMLLIIEPAFEIFRRSHDRVVSADRRFRLPELAGRIEASGFRVESSTYFFACLALPALVLSAYDRLSTRGAPKSDLERSSALDGIFASAAGLELRLAAKALAGRGKSPIRIGTSVVVVASKR
jgi:SAM-dependent methyltransferase